MRKISVILIFGLFFFSSLASAVFTPYFTKNIGLRTNVTWPSGDKNFSGVYAVFDVGLKTSVVNNRPVEISNPSITNGSENVALSTVFWNVTISDPDGDDVNWTIETSPDVGNNSANNESGGIKNCSLSGLVNEVTYTVYVNASDVVNKTVVSRWYTFKTEPVAILNVIQVFYIGLKTVVYGDAPIADLISPSNGSTDIDMYPLLIVNVTDFQSDDFDISWSTNASGSWVKSNVSCSNGIFRQRATFANESNTKYWWSINVNDTNHQWSNYTFNFRTRSYSWRGWSDYWVFTKAIVINPPSTLSAIPYNTTGINVTWTENPDTNYTYIRYSTTGYPSSITSGTLLVNTTNSAYNHTGLTPGTSYYYSAWSYDEVTHAFSSTYNTSYNCTKTSMPSNFQVTIVNTNNVTLAWTKAFNATYTMIVQNSSTWHSYPIIPLNGTMVYFDSGSSCVASGLKADTKYYYSAWSWRNCGGFSLTNATLNVTTGSGNPVIETRSPSGIEETYATLNGYSYDSYSTSLIIRPTGAGTYTNNFPFGAANNWDCVNDVVADEDSTYVDPEGTTWRSDTYNVDDHTTETGIITSVVVYLRAKGTTSGPSYLLAAHVLTGGTLYSSSTIELSPSYSLYSFSWNTNPKTGVAWTWADIDNLQIGLNQRDWGGFTVTTQCYASVNYLPINNTVDFEYGLTEGYGSNTTDELLTVPCLFSYNLSSLSQGTLYHYRARGVNGVGTTYGADKKILTKPNAPSGLNITPSGLTDISLSWTKGTGANNTRIQRKTTGYPSSPFDGTNVYNSTGTFYKDSSLTPGQIYYYRIWSYSKWDTEGKFSDGYLSGVALVKPGNATGLIVYQSGTGHSLSWTHGTGYTNSIVRGQIGSYPANTTSGNSIYNGSSNVCSNLGLTVGDTWFYRVWEYSLIGGLSQISANYSEYNLTYAIPTIITNDASGITLTNATLHGSLLYSSVPTTVKFQYGLTTGYGSESSSYVLPGAGSFSRTVTGLTPGSVYHFRAYGNTSTNSSVGLDKYLLTKPVPPVNVSISTLSSTTFRLSWNFSGGHNTTYVVRKAGSAPTSISDGTIVYNSTSNSFEDINLTPAVHYYYAFYTYVHYGIYTWFSSSASYVDDTTYPINPPVITVYVTANSTFGVVPKGKIVVNATATQGDFIYINITVNSDAFNDIVSNPGSTGPHWFTLNENGSNFVHVLATDTGGNYYNYYGVFYIYIVNLSIVNERTGELLDWTRARINGNMTGCYLTVQGKSFIVDLFKNRVHYLTYTTMSEDVIRINTTYKYTSVPIQRIFTVSLMDNRSSIGLVETETQFYEQVLYSFEEKAVVVKNSFSQCYISCGYTKFAYESYYSFSVPTIDQLYYLYTLDDGNRVLLASIDGGKATNINLDFLTYSLAYANVSLTTDELTIYPYSDTTILLFYYNIRGDNDHVQFRIYDNTTLLFNYIEYSTPDEVFIYFNWGTLDLLSDILRVDVSVTKEDGTMHNFSRYINLAVTVAPRTVGGFPAPVAAIISIGLAMFGLTLVSKKQVFGIFGIIVLIAAIAVTAIATPQEWYLRLLQVVYVILLMFVFLVFKEEGAHAV